MRNLPEDRHLRIVRDQAGYVNSAQGTALRNMQALACDRLEHGLGVATADALGVRQQRWCSNRAAVGCGSLVCAQGLEPQDLSYYAVLQSFDRAK